MLPILALAAFLSIQPTNAVAADHRNSDEGFPISVEDAYPIATGSVESSVSAKILHLQDKTYVLELDSGVDWGAFRNAQVGIQIGQLLALTHDAGNPGDVVVLKISSLYNLNQESDKLPAISVGPKIEIPTGDHDELGTFHATIPLILTQTFGKVRADINAGLVVNVGTAPDLRTAGYKVGAAVSFQPRFDTAIYAGVSTESGLMKSWDNLTLFEAGIRYRLSTTDILSIGIGSGFGIGNNPEQPDFTIMVGWQHEF